MRFPTSRLRVPYWSVSRACQGVDWDSRIPQLTPSEVRNREVGGVSARLARAGCAEKTKKIDPCI